LKRPILRIVNKPSADGIESNVFPFLKITFLTPESVMKSVSLKEWLRRSDCALHKALPVFDPVGNGYFLIGGRAEQMDVVGHNNVIADEPCIRFLPGLDQGLIHFSVRKVSSPMPCADSQKDNRGNRATDVNGLWRMSAGFH